MLIDRIQLDTREGTRKVCAFRQRILVDVFFFVIGLIVAKVLCISFFSGGNHMVLVLDLQEKF